MFKKPFKNKLLGSSRGFTLIELLVVVSIIGLLSSIVLASLKTAKDKAKISKFRQEVEQFKVAIELYKADNGSYPGESSDCLEHDFSVFTNTDGSISYTANRVCQYGVAQISYSNMAALLIPKYISKFPSPPPQSTERFFVFDTGPEKCVGDTSPVPYVLAVWANEKGFEDWPYYSLDGITPYGGISPTYRCFSL